MMAGLKTDWPFSVDKEVGEFSTDNNLRRYQSKFQHICQNCVKNNERSYYHVTKPRMYKRWNCFPASRGCFPGVR